MEFKRIQTIEENLSPKRVLMVYGPRRIGKTTLVRQYLEKNSSGKKIKYDVGDDIRLRQLFNSEQRKEILEYAEPYDIIVIDEAQQIEKIGIAAKIIIDAFPEKIFILTGSSSFDLSQQVGEPLTGRHFVLTLLPIAQIECVGSVFEKKTQLEDFLLFGGYPEVLFADSREQKIRILNELVSSYLFKDVLALDRLRSPELLLDIVRCLAFQIGNEVSFNEISRTVGADVKKVQRYIDVLEKAFVIKKVKAYSSNKRNEVAKRSKFYFYDTGVRNAVIGQFNHLEDRNDIGGLWENFIFMELYKKIIIHRENAVLYFWRTSIGAEVDIVKELGGYITAFECKWSKDISKNLSKFKELYSKAETQVVNRENYLDLLL